MAGGGRGALRPTPDTQRWAAVSQPLGETKAPGSPSSLLAPGVTSGVADPRFLPIDLPQGRGLSLCLFYDPLESHLQGAKSQEKRPGIVEGELRHTGGQGRGTGPKPRGAGDGVPVGSSGQPTGLRPRDSRTGPGERDQLLLGVPGPTWPGGTHRCALTSSNDLASSIPIRGMWGLSGPPARRVVRKVKRTRAWKRLWMDGVLWL